MNYVKYNPFDPFNLKTFNKVIDDVAGRSLSEFFDAAFVASSPPINIVETENAYNIEVAAPGLKKEDFDIAVEKEHLIVSVKSENKKEDHDTYSRREFNYTSFSRKFYLSEDVDRGNITANYKDGILLISLALKEVEIEVKKKVEVD